MNTEQICVDKELVAALLDRHEAEQLPDCYTIDAAFADLRAIAKDDQIEIVDTTIERIAILWAALQTSHALFRHSLYDYRRVLRDLQVDVEQMHASQQSEELR